mmetsp:Transcript_9589/g.23517  ORF Transcript_9589/g.23517 Transcript_9589/m.23517 type:complete len:321 (+) Transcript_9589:2490-3452(+)
MARRKPKNWVPQISPPPVAIPDAEVIKLGLLDEYSFSIKPRSSSDGISRAETRQEKRQSLTPFSLIRKVPLPPARVLGALFPQKLKELVLRKNFHQFLRRSGCLTELVVYLQSTTACSRIVEKYRWIATTDASQENAVDVSYCAVEAIVGDIFVNVGVFIFINVATVPLALFQSVKIIYSVKIIWWQYPVNMSRRKQKVPNRLHLIRASDDRRQILATGALNQGRATPTVSSTSRFVVVALRSSGPELGRGHDRILLMAADAFSSALGKMLLVKTVVGGSRTFAVVDVAVWMLRCCAGAVYLPPVHVFERCVRENIDVIS